MKLTMNRILKKLLVVILLSMAPAYFAFAQSASESYENGMALMKKKNYEAAIKCFKASMVINKSAANVKNCNAQIAKCQKAMSSKKNQPSPVAVEKKLTITTPILYVPANPDKDYSVPIETYPESNDWMATVEGKPGWLELSKSMDGKNLQIRVKPVDKTIVRSAEITVTYDNLSRKMDIHQVGQKVNLFAEKSKVKFKKKGSNEDITIQCNSDTVYANKLNWYVDEAPEWCHTEETMTNLVIKVDPIEKSSPFYKSGRTGVINIKSQDQKLTILLEQN